MEIDSKSPLTDIQTAVIPRKLNIWLPLLLSVILIIGILLGVSMKHNPPTISNIPGNKEEGSATGALGQGKLEELIRYIDSRYVDIVNKDYLVKEAIDKILLQLDPHSSYISAAEFKAVSDQLEGNYDGIGIEFVVIDDTVMISGILPNGPAETAGILANDKIVEIQDSLKTHKGFGHEEALRLLKGKSGTKIILGVLRNEESKPRYFTVQREKIPVKSVEVAYMLDEVSGYVRIGRFSSRTFEEFMNALDDMVDKHGMTNLVLDLRQNPGGYLQEATNILSQLFREKDKLLVYTKGRNVRNMEYKSTGRAFHNIYNIAVLVDEGSASASEIIAGAVQDWDRGPVIGRRTFGKGLVQEQYRLRDGSAIRLTVARYYTPSGRCIQKPYGERKEYTHDLLNRVESGEVYDESVFENPDTTKYYTMAGRLVYGGGGIQPDEFVPLNPVLLNPYYLRLQRHVAPFTFRYLEKNQKLFADVKLEDFIKSYYPDESVAQLFINYALEHGEANNESQWRKVKPELLAAIKINIARNIWSDEGFYRVKNQSDTFILKATSLLKQKNPTKSSKVK